MRRKAKRKEKVSIIEIFVLLLSIISLLIGWMGYGGILFGLPALLLGFIYYRKKGGLISLLTIIFGCIGLAETIVMLMFISMFTSIFDREVVGEKIDIISAKFTAREYLGEYSSVLVVNLSESYTRSFADIFLYDPNGNVVASGDLFYNDKSGELKLRTENICDLNAGKYTIIIKSPLEEILAKKSVYFSGHRLEIEDIDLSLDTSSEYGIYVKRVIVKIKNSGDLPAVISGVRIKIGKYEDYKRFYSEEAPPKKTIEIKFEY